MSVYAENLIARGHGHLKHVGRRRGQDLICFWQGGGSALCLGCNLEEKGGGGGCKANDFEM